MNTIKTSHLFGSKRTAYHFEKQIIITWALLYTGFILAWQGVFPLWLLLFISPILIVRWMLAVHELFHLKTDTEVWWTTRFLAMSFTPLALGYREFRNIHLRHHEYMNTKQDAEFFQIKGGYISGFWNALTSPDQALFRWIGYLRNTHQTKTYLDSRFYMEMVFNNKKNKMLKVPRIYLLFNSIHIKK